MKYVKELDSISDFPDTFLKELDRFFINTNLTSVDREKLVKIIKENLYSAKFTTKQVK
jgi:hypothetical protein